MHILLLECGRPPPSVDSHFGSFRRWFREALPDRGITVTTAYARRSLDVSPGAFDRVIATGSLSSVSERQFWMLDTARFLLRAAEARVPVLGVCFGHQLLAMALGGRIAPHSEGWQAGTVECELTASGREDPLFRGVPPSFHAQAAHQETVVELPPFAEVLARSDHTSVQAFRAGPWIHGVQFHPELAPAGTEAHVRTMTPALTRTAATTPFSYGRAVIENFLAGVAETRTPQPLN